MKDDTFVRWVMVSLQVFIICLFITLIARSDNFQSRLDTETTIASLKNRWCQLNDDLQSLRKENEKLRRDVRRIKAGKDDDYERREAE